MLVQLVLASFVSTLQDVTLAVTWIEVLKARRAETSEGLLDQSGVVIGVGHAVVLSGLTPLFILLLLLVEQ